MKIKCNKIFLILALACSCVLAHANVGDSCEDPIMVGEKYRAQISGAGVKWYVVNTFDLPLTVRFYSQDNMAPPDLYLDFSCTTGVYDDSILCSLFCAEKVGALSLPYHVSPVWKMDAQNNVYYEISMGEWYRNLLLENGISYNVEVLIKAVYYGAGEIILSPDAEFSECMETEDWLLLGRTLSVAADDEDTYFIAPYSNWAGETVRYIWQGEYPATVILGTSCDFDPMDGTDDRRIDVMRMKAGTDTIKHTSDDIAYYMTYMNNPTNTAKGGIFYVKVISAGAGTLKVEQEPVPVPKGGATLLKYGETANVYRNDTSSVYAIPSKWTRAMQFNTPTDHVFRMYVGTTADFYLKDAFATYQFDRTAEGHILSLLDADMTSIWSHKIGDEYYLYVRFECTENTTVLPTLWAPSECVTKSKRIQMRQQFEVVRNSNAIYGLYYEEIKGGDITMAWSSTQTACPFYISDTCSLSNTDKSRAFYTGSIPKNNSITYSQDVVASWEQYMDPDGYLYILFYPNAKAKITVTTSAPKEEDPQCDTYDSVLTVSAWDSYEWRGKTYNTDGTYHKNGNIDPVTNCADTLYILRLTIHTTGHGTYKETGCDSIIYNGKKYTESGIYVDTLYKANGNRTVMELDFTIHHATTGEQTVSACDSYEWNNTTYTESGDYKTVLTNAAGCDSTVTLHLTIYEPQANTDTTAIVWDSIVWYGTTYKTSGEYPLEMIGEGGCTWTHTLHLTVHTTSHDNYMESGCDSIIYNDKKYTESGIFADTLYDASGNRTIMTLDFTIHHATTGEQTVSACDSYEWNETTYTESGEYQTVLTNAAGCDSIVTLHLTIHTSNANTDTVAEVWDSIVWYGTTYKTSGEYPIEMSGEGGCTWTHTLHLTVHTTRYVVYEYNQCDSLILYDQLYTESGEYIDTIMEVDSNRTITALHLTIGKTSYDEVSATLYEPYISPSGKIYTESGDYTDTITNLSGCDSIITTHLTIYKTTYDTIEPMIGCDSIVFEGKTYTQSIAYNDTITAANGDRTIKSVSITINHTTYSELSVTKKGEYISPGGITYTESGDYTETTTNAAGCDSIITLHVTISEVIYDTVYFCRGYNREHDVQVNEILVRRYLPYTYEVPSSFNYREGMILEKGDNQVLVDFNIAEANLYDHYTHGLTPVQSIAWSIRYPSAGAYEPIIVEEGPQWINFGTLAVQIQFRCGETYNDALPMGIEETEAAQQPVKRIENGQVVIIRGGATYTLMGQRIGD